MKKCVFLDRDGVINIDDVNYTYKVEQFILVKGVKEALQLLHAEYPICPHWGWSGS